MWIILEARCSCFMLDISSLCYVILNDYYVVNDFVMTMLRWKWPCYNYVGL